VIPTPTTPVKKRVVKEEIKAEKKGNQSSTKKITDKDFKKYLQDIQNAAESAAPMPKLSAVHSQQAEGTPVSKKRGSSRASP